jgi:hydroxypyruvate reductase
MIGNPPRYVDHRVHLDRIIHAALRAADPDEAVRRHWAAAELADAEHAAERVFVVGAGKAGVAMVEAAVDLLLSPEGRPRSLMGVLAVPRSSASSSFLPPHFSLIPAGHPKPDAGSLRAGEAIAELLSGATERDVVLALISGGGSALMELPVPGLTLADLQSLTDQLLHSGASITEFNCVRKHLSRLKGGGLARLAAPARLIALILSDVIGDPLDVIASGPTVPDPTTVDEARTILERYHIHSGLADSDLQSRLIETPKPGDPIFARVSNHLIGSNTLARQAAADAARSLGFPAELPDRIVQGEAREWGAALATEFARRRVGPSPGAFIYGGETTVTVRGDGVGGRNQELALAAAIALDSASHHVVIASLGTDGVDGATPAAGAVATPETARRARALGLDPAAMLQANDSHSFFAALGDCLITGPTGTNVNDLVIVLTYPN